MAMLYDFRCPTGTVTELFVKSDEFSVSCPCCGEEAGRLIPSPRSVLEPFSGDFVGATDKWCKHREITIAKERKAEEG